MKRAWVPVLRTLALQPDEFVLAIRLPNGHGRVNGGLGVGASNQTLREMETAGLIEYGKKPTHSLRGYRITPAGRAALAAKEEQR